MLYLIGRGSIVSSRGTNAFNMIRESIHNDKSLGIKCSVRNLGICRGDIEELLSVVQNSGVSGLVYDSSKNLLVFHDVLSMFQGVMGLIESMSGRLTLQSVRLLRLLRGAYDVIQMELLSEELGCVCV